MYWLDGLFTFLLVHIYVLLIPCSITEFSLPFCIYCSYSLCWWSLRCEIHCISQVIRTIMSVWVLCGEWTLSSECHADVRNLRNCPWNNDAYLYGIVNSSGNSGLPKFHTMTCMDFVVFYLFIFSFVKKNGCLSCLR